MNTVMNAHGYWPHPTRVDDGSTSSNCHVTMATAETTLRESMQDLIFTGI